MKFQLLNLNKTIYSTILTPLLLSVYPIVALWAYNFNRLQTIVVILPPDSFEDTSTRMVEYFPDPI